MLCVGTLGLVLASIAFLLRTQGPANRKNHPRELLCKQIHQQDPLIEQALERLSAPRQPNESDEEYQQRRKAVARQERVPSLDQTEWQQEVVTEAMPEVDGQTEGEQEGQDLDMMAYKYDSGGKSEGELRVHRASEDIINKVPKYPSSIFHQFRLNTVFHQFICCMKCHCIYPYKPGIQLRPAFVAHIKGRPRVSHVTCLFGGSVILWGSCLLCTLQEILTAGPQILARMPIIEKSN